ILRGDGADANGRGSSCSPSTPAARKPRNRLPSPNAGSAEPYGSPPSSGSRSAPTRRTISVSVPGPAEPRGSLASPTADPPTVPSTIPTPSARQKSPRTCVRIHTEACDRGWGAARHAMERTHGNLAERQQPWPAHRGRRLDPRGGEEREHQADRQAVRRLR